MVESPPGYESIHTSKHRSECLELRLVLDAMGIFAETVHGDDGWTLVVKQDDRAAAAAEIEAYRRENAAGATSPRIAEPVLGGAVVAVALYTGIISLLSILTVRQGFGLDWLSAGRMQAGKVMAGEVWRTATALTLHLDAEHLFANLLFGSVFGFLAGRLLGGGVAWLAILIAGALGNFMNATVQPPNHSSIGASTAVFAALGMIVSHALRPRGEVATTPLRRWSPLIGGVLLLAFMGVGGERTDVLAHVTGFMAGLLVGWAGCRLPHRWLASGWTQWAAGIGALAIVIAAWTAALIAS